ncbi:type II secretion system F family protein [Amaricoccus macauensis]|uniref:type II secretion system F family protein n=1 Tax=Amaricoccus macauensis TaxID=57001 RepID=UPI003C799476
MRDLDPVLVLQLFAVATVIVFGLGIGVILTVMKSDRAHKARLKRVSRGRIVGKLDLEEVRLKLQRPDKNPGLAVRLSDMLAGFIPILNTQRLRENFVRGGIEATIGRYLALNVFLGFVVAGIAWFVLPYHFIVCLIGAMFVTMYLMDAYVRMKGDRMAARFMGQLPDALDTIIRGIRSGIPVSECIKTVGKEFDDPIGAYFASIGERVKLGESLDVALWGVARIVRRPEMDFLAISITIQMETGGSLAEALAGLADLLRKRQQMRLKIRAISSEAKASALIIGALPFFMLALLSAMAPQYVAPLFSDPRGNVMLGIGLLSICIGAFVMWRMTQFEI